MIVSKNKKIYFGFSPNYEDGYEARPTLVFFGDPDSFAIFADWMEEFSKKKKGSINLSKVPIFTRNYTDIILKLVSRVTGMQQIDNNTFEWGISLKEFGTFINYLRGLSRVPINETRWQFLDSDVPREIEVVATVGEGEYVKSAFK